MFSVNYVSKRIFAVFIASAFFIDVEGVVRSCSCPISTMEHLNSPLLGDVQNNSEGSPKLQLGEECVVDYYYTENDDVMMVTTSPEGDIFCSVAEYNPDVTFLSLPQPICNMNKSVETEDSEVSSDTGMIESETSSDVGAFGVDGEDFTSSYSSDSESSFGIMTKLTNELLKIISE